MAAYLMPVQPQLVVRASASNSTSTSSSTAGNQKSDQQRKSWWTPLFGWSSEPDYFDSKNSDITTANNDTFSARSGDSSDSQLDRKRVRSRVSPVNFTDEKARKLRILTMETEIFHDAMYHSAIASRLASDFSDRSDR